MKKQILVGLITLSSILTGNAQIYTPNGIIQGSSNNNNVGIGTTTPISNLEVASSLGGVFSITTNKASGTSASPLRPAIDFLGYGNGNKARITATEETYNTHGSRLSILLNAGASETNLVERFTILQSGYIGIGTTTPISNLEVASSSGGILSITTNKANGTSASPLRPAIDFLGYGNGNKARITATEETYNTHGSRLSILLNAGASETNLVERLTILQNGYIGIGTTMPSYKLDVAGTIRACEVKVDLLNGCDFVFKNDYKLMDLKELEKFVKTNQHLPEIASEKEMVENGVNMKDLQMKLLQKMEEMTLYMIEQNKKIEALENEIKELKTK